MIGSEVGIECRPIGILLIEEKTRIIVLVRTHMKGMTFRFPFQGVSGLLSQGVTESLAMFRFDIKFNSDDIHVGSSG